MNPRVREAIERRVSDEELRTALEWTPTAEEREQFRSLVDWFTRRYPTGAERLAYARRAYARWQRTIASCERS